MKNKGDDTFSVKTTGLEEKATACQMIMCYAKELKYAFADYVEETVQIMIPLLNFYFHERIRTAAAECLPYLVESGKAKGEAFVKNMWEFIFPELLKSIEFEPEKDVLCDMFASLGSCIECVGKDNISESQINQTILTLRKYLEEHFANVEERKHRRGDEDYDEGVEKELVEEDDEDCYVLSKISEVIHSLFVVFKEAFLPHFEILLPLFIKLAGADRSYTEVQWSICVMDDCVEFTGQHSIKYKEFFLPLFINGMRSEHPEIRQASAYGFGVIGKNGGPSFAQDCAQSIPILVQMIQDPESRSDLNNLATENAISSVTKIMQYNNSHLNVNEIIPVWFSWLPAWEDESELPYIYNFLFMLIENKHPAILDENNTNLPRLLQIFAEVLCRNAVEVNGELGQKILMFINSLKVWY